MSSTILLSDNGATSGISGYQLTGGTDGTLTIQTTTSGGTPTTALTIGTNQVVTFAQPPAGIDAFPSGTAMMFVQTSAPTGWTKSTSHDNKALRVVSGTASSGGAVAFTTAFASKAVSGTVGNTTATNQDTTAGGTVGNTTLTEGQLPSHRHYVRGDARSDSVGIVFGGNGSASVSNLLPGVLEINRNSYSGTLYGWYTGNGESHNHSFSGSSHNHTQNAHNHSFTGDAINMAVQYVDVIIATKD